MHLRMHACMHASFHGTTLSVAPFFSCHVAVGAGNIFRLRRTLWKRNLHFYKLLISG